MAIMQFSFKGRGNDNRRIWGRGKNLCPLPPPVKMSEGPLTRSNCKTNRAQSSNKAGASLEKGQGQPRGAGSLAYILFLKVKKKKNGKINPQQAEYITCNYQRLEERRLKTGDS